MTSLYSHDIISLLFQWIINQNYKKKSTGDWSQSRWRSEARPNYVWTVHCDNVFERNANSEGPDQYAHPRSLSRAFAVRLKNHWILQNV